MKLTYLESEAQCMAYILAKWPRKVFLVLKLTLLMAGTSLVTSLKVVSATANRASYVNRHRGFNAYKIVSHNDKWCALIRNWSQMPRDLGI